MAVGDKARLNPFSFAVKNLLRRPTRSFLTLIGISISIGVLFSFISFNTGFEKGLNKEMESLGVHMLAVAKGCPYEATALILHGGDVPNYLTVDDFDAISKIPGIGVAAPLYMAQLYENTTDSLVIVSGVTSDTTKLKPYLEFDSSSDSWALVGSTAFSEEKMMKPGESINIKGKEFIVKKILEPTGGQDDSMVFVNLEKLHELTGKPDQITAVSIKLSDISQIGLVKKAVEEIPDVQAVPMSQVVGTIQNLVGSARLMVSSVLLVAIVVAVIGILNTVVMSVFERTTELGMLRAMGSSPADIFTLILVETLIISISGGVIGTTGALLGSRIIESFVRQVLPFAPKASLLSFDPVLLMLCILASGVIGVVSSLYPCFLASKVSPLEAVRNG